MQQDLDVELSILEDLFIAEQNKIIWDTVSFIGDRRIGKT
jgi:hypothetical protein